MELPTHAADHRVSFAEASFVRFWLKSRVGSPPSSVRSLVMSSELSSRSSLTAVTRLLVASSLSKHPAVAARGDAQSDTTPAH